MFGSLRGLIHPAVSFTRAHHETLRSSTWAGSDMCLCSLRCSRRRDTSSQPLAASGPFARSAQSCPNLYLAASRNPLGHSTLLTLRLLMSYTGCNRRKGQNFGRVFLMLKYTDITQNTYVQSWTVTEIMAREKCGLLAGLPTIPCQLTALPMPALDWRARLQEYRYRCSSKLPMHV